MGTWQKFTRPNVSSEMSSAAERQQSSEACSDHATDSVVELMGANGDGAGKHQH